MTNGGIKLETNQLTELTELTELNIASMSQLLGLVDFGPSYCSVMVKYEEEKTVKLSSLHNQSH